VVTKIRVEYGRKMDQIQKTKFLKNFNGEITKTERGTWRKT